MTSDTDKLIGVLMKERDELRIALADAIRRPMGVIPDSAQGLVSGAELDLAERRRVAGRGPTKHTSTSCF